MLLEIPRGFEKAQANGQSPAALIAVNTVNGTKGGLGSAYLQQILNPSSSQDSVRYRFNPYLNYKVFMVPALMTMILVLLCGFLPALNVVSERKRVPSNNQRESGQPLYLHPCQTVALLGHRVCGTEPVHAVGLAGVRINSGRKRTDHLPGHPDFALVMSGLGLVISNYSSTMQQAMFVMWFCMLISS